MRELKGYSGRQPHRPKGQKENMMDELKARIERMLAGEQKRREVALRFLDAAQEVSTPACQEIYGDGDTDEMIIGGTYVGHPQESDCGLFFWATSRDGWKPGWYFGPGAIPAEDARGKIFWSGIHQAVEFIDYIDQRLAAQAKSRESLVEKIRERFGISG
jgi:hypothetical protein